MKIADLYIRVSTDEQADKGYSQRNQEEMLRRYCEFNQVTINRVIYEDHSAKSFNRPAWTQLLSDLKKKANHSNCILFTKWDRFSRNAGDAYQMINLLRSFRVEPQAIEQPLDLSIPENKMMLAIYLAAPEVENDRRALNILHGMRRARKEGRYMGKAPVGYINKINEDGKKYITPIQPDALILVWVFEEIVKGTYAIEQIYKEAIFKGLKCGRTPFWYAIRNPAYCGKVLVSGYKDEQTYYADGQHEPIISESLFYEVQDFLNGKKKTYRTQVGAKDVFHLKGFLLCPKCGKLLTASASKGRNHKYNYYHCNAKCGTRFKAENTNELFLANLRKLVPYPGAIESYAHVIKSAYSTRNKVHSSEVSSIKSELEKLNRRLTNARDLLLDKELDPNDYKKIKTETEQEIHALELRLFSTTNARNGSIDQLLSKGLGALTKLDEQYCNAESKNKRKIVGSIFPEKMVFDGVNFRTTRLNEVVRLIYTLEADSSGNKKGENSVKTEISYCVDP